MSKQGRCENSLGGPGVCSPRKFLIFMCLNAISCISRAVLSQNIVTKSNIILVNLKLFLTISDQLLKAAVGALTYLQSLWTTSSTSLQFTLNLHVLNFSECSSH